MGLTSHELRHTAASPAMSAGADVRAVQRMLGHASAAMTLDVCSGLFDDDVVGVAARLDELIRRVEPRLERNGSRLRESNLDLRITSPIWQAVD